MLKEIKKNHNQDLSKTNFENICMWIKNTIFQKKMHDFFVSNCVANNKNAQKSKKVGLTWMLGKQHKS